MAEVVKWIMVAWFTVAALSVIATIGRPKKPTTPGAAAVTALLITLEIIAILAYWET